ncbi:MAG: hypothetical protein AAGB51_03970 [Planctomycetota bacterium]
MARKWFNPDDGHVGNGLKFVPLAILIFSVYAYMYSVRPHFNKEEDLRAAEAQVETLETELEQVNNAIKSLQAAVDETSRELGLATDREQIAAADASEAISQLRQLEVIVRRQETLLGADAFAVREAWLEATAGHIERFIDVGVAKYMATIGTDLTFDWRHHLTKESDALVSEADSSVPASAAVVITRNYLESVEDDDPIKGLLGLKQAFIPYQFSDVPLPSLE